MAVGIGVMEEYTYFREQCYLAHRNAIDVIQEVHAQWAKEFGRKYGLFEEFMMHDADVCLVVMGSNSMLAKAAVKKLRKAGKKAGVVRLRVIRPFPEEQLKKTLSKVKAIGVIDQNLSPGRGGILYPEIKAALYGRNVPVSDFIISLGGHPISQQHFEDMLEEVMVSAKTGKEKKMWQNV
jgi:pyruvate ferredoxin oxidoreductase alpha subunit